MADDGGSSPATSQAQHKRLQKPWYRLINSLQVPGLQERPRNFPSHYSGMSGQPPGSVPSGLSSLLPVAFLEQHLGQILGLQPTTISSPLLAFLPLSSSVNETVYSRLYSKNTHTPPPLRTALDLKAAPLGTAAQRLGSAGPRSPQTLPVPVPHTC